jgi:hypothetical protein
MATPDALELQKARFDLGLANGKKKLEILTEGQDPRGLIQALPPQELYLAMLDIGLDDCAPIVALASPQQFKHFIDASCWPRRDAPPDPRKIMRWLTLAREGGGTSDLALRRFHTKLANLDVELFALLLRREFEVIDLTENEFPELPDEAMTWTTPDRRYMVVFNEEGSPYAILKRLLDDLAQENPFHVSRMLEALRWELPSELEETSRRWRDGRLRDAGVPDLEEALAFVARPARKAGAPETGLHANNLHTNDLASSKSTALTATLQVQPMLERAMSKLGGQAQVQAEESIAYAANAALVAWKVQVDDPEELRPALLNARGLLSLGLELLSNGDEEEAARIISDEPVRTVFQAAMAELYRLQTRARAAAQAARLPESQRTTLFGPPLSSLLEALNRTPPVLDGVRLHSAYRHAPESRAEIARADLLIDEATTLPRLLLGMELTPAILGLAATAAEIAPTALRASDAIAALVRSDLRGVPFSLKELPEPGAPLPEGFAQRLDVRLNQGLDSNPDGPERAAARRLSDRLRSAVLAR